MTVWAAFGGIVHAVAMRRQGRVLGIADVFALSFVSGFAGMMWGLVAIKFYPGDVAVISFASGLGGFMSLEGIAVLINYLRKKFGVQ